MLLTNIAINGRVVRLSDQTFEEETNSFTVVIGDNGCGKSRIFQGICSAFISVSSNELLTWNNYGDIVNFSNSNSSLNMKYMINGVNYSVVRNNLPYRDKIHTANGYIDLLTCHPYEEAKVLEIKNVDEKALEGLERYFLAEVKKAHSKLNMLKNNQAVNEVQLPNRILAITGSPYDKFPFINRNGARNNLKPYVYLGTRAKEVNGFSSNNNYLRGKFDQLGASFIKLLLKPKHEYLDFSKVFDFLDIKPSFQLNLAFNERLTDRDVTQDTILQLVRSVKFFKDKEHMELDDSEELASALFKAYKYVLPEHYINREYSDPFKRLSVSCSVQLDKSHEDKQYLECLELLSEFDLLELDDVEFYKNSTNEKFLLSSASSGELSLLFTFSSIAGEIENDSLILIDEPELSLHPSWQLRFLSLLSDTFDNYKKCHFIIATHSPSIISSIPSKNSSILSLSSDDSKLVSSDEFKNRSVDYQLAKAFSAPGNSNEYLVKMAINIFSKIKNNKVFDEEDIENLDFLNGIREKLPKDDCVLELINMLNEVHEKYGRD